MQKIGMNSADIAKFILDILKIDVSGEIAKSNNTKVLFMPQHSSNLPQFAKDTPNDTPNDTTNDMMKGFIRANIRAVIHGMFITLLQCMILAKWVLKTVYY